MRVNAARDFGQTGDEAVAGDAPLVRLAGTGGPGDGGRAHDDEAGAALGTLFVIVLGAFAADAVGAAVVLAHGGHDDAVLQLHRADTARLQH
ncbi:hypothetical protein SDC9_126310 [bioreactor metagenome]|uniref:Uncharacterized protein n=1 Tax=bioreactor metagenome TaxID=1076179 RepID=A0A645CQU3_9ZZZZ